MAILSHIRMLSILLLLACGLSACATTGSADKQGYTAAAQSDPLEPFNRAMHSFNTVLDDLILDPLAELYQWIVPDFLAQAIHSALLNLTSPVIFANALLQGDLMHASDTFWRFFVNSSLGVAGLFDIATEAGMPAYRSEDFGQTMGVWGVDHGAYLVLPVLGPSSARDGLGRLADWLMDPFSWAFSDGEVLLRSGLRVVDTRVELDPVIDRVNETSLDSYATFRSLYLQRRAAEIRNR